jgi:hypothetical protein
MQLSSIKVAVAAAWVLAVLVAGLAGITSSMDSVLGWIVLACVAVLPPVVMMWWWKDPGPSLSESIQEARR